MSFEMVPGFPVQNKRLSGAIAKCVGLRNSTIELVSNADFLSNAINDSPPETEFGLEMDLSAATIITKGAEHYKAFVNIATQDIQHTDYDRANDILKSEYLFVFLHILHDIPVLLNFGNMILHRSGTTSFIFKASSEHASASALKLLQPAYLNVEPILQATEKYREAYGRSEKYSAEVFACGPCWVLMRFIEGPTLAEYLTEIRSAYRFGTIQYIDKLSLLLQLITDALSFFAREPKKIVHGDLSPFNILIEVSHDRTVRRQGFWNRWLLDLSEILAHLLVDIRRLGCGIANAAV